MVVHYALKYSHCITGMPSDAAHDFLEGVIPYVLTSVVVKFVEKSFFTLEDFNDVLENFDYARNDRRDIPETQKIDSLSSFKIKLTAGESWVLGRLFPLMFGAYVPVDDQIWDIVLRLSGYLELLMSFELSQGAVERMDCTLRSLYERISIVLPECEMKPKFHFGIHYGMQTRLNGPPRTRFTLRYESKHMAMKQPLNNSKNRKNICLTVANRHQAQLYLRLREENFFSLPQFVPINFQQVHRKCLAQDLQSLLPSVIKDDVHVINISSGVKVNDGSFYEDDIVLYNDASGDLNLSDVYVPTN